MKQLTDSAQLSRFVLKGFKSIAACDLELGSLNILVGPNGAGKSNFVEFFRMIRQILEGNLQLYVSRQGGPDALLHFGRKKTGKIEAQLYFGNNGYWCALEPTKKQKRGQGNFLLPYLISRCWLCQYLQDVPWQVLVDFRMINKFSNPELVTLPVKHLQFCFHSLVVPRIS